MRTLSRCLALCLSFSTAAIAQDAVLVADTRDSWSLFGGATRTMIGGADGKAAGYVNKMGYALGFSFQRESQDRKRFFRTGGTYALRGGHQDDPSSTDWFDLNLGYVEVPVLVGRHLGHIGRVRPHIMAGFHVAFLLPCTFRFHIGGSENTKKCDEASVDFDTDRLDFAPILGGGLQVPILGRTIELNASYEWGRATISGEEAPPNLLNRGMLFTVGYVLR